LYVSGRESFIDDLVMKAGGGNVFSDVEGCKLVDLEEVIIRNPQVIIGANYPQSMAEEWAKTEPRLRSVEARKDGRVYAVDTDLVERPGPRIVEGLEQVAKCVHPEIFGPP
jgi:iron complex transport system substrate-binding protein